MNDKPLDAGDGKVFPFAAEVALAVARTLQLVFAIGQPLQVEPRQGQPGIAGRLVLLHVGVAAPFVQAEHGAVAEHRQVAISPIARFERFVDGPVLSFVVTQLDGEVPPVARLALGLLAV
jgi:hypothetical protein